MMKKIILLITIILSILLTGCWNYRELKELSIVTGMAIDKNKENGKYIVTVEITTPKGQKDINMISDVISIEGDTVFDAVRLLILKNGKRLYWPHAKILIISEDIAKEGIFPALDFVNRDAEVRADIRILMSKDCNARNILQGKEKIHDSISFHMNDMMDAKDAVQYFRDARLWRFLNEISSKGIEPTLPKTFVIESGDEVVPEINGTAIFREDKYIGELDGLETKSFLVIIGEAKEGIYVIKDIGGSDESVTLESFAIKSKIKPEIVNGQLIVKIKVEMDASIGEITGIIDFMDDGKRKMLEEASREQIKKRLEDVIKKAQQEYDSDIFGFGNKIKYNMPNLWKEIESEWDDKFKEIKTEVDVSIQIKRSALLSKPIKKGD